jgi:hypothetical protein
MKPLYSSLNHLIRHLNLAIRLKFLYHLVVRHSEHSLRDQCFS